MHVIVKRGFQRIRNPQTEAPCREPFPASRAGNRPLKQERCELLRFSIHRLGIRARLRSAIAVSPPGHCQSRFPARCLAFVSPGENWRFKRERLGNHQNEERLKNRALQGVLIFGEGGFRFRRSFEPGGDAKDEPGEYLLRYICS
jgi:hypothetical protein